MLVRSLVSYRWGNKTRAPSSLVRVSVSTRRLLNSIPDRWRRDFVDRAIRSFFHSDWWLSKQNH